MYVRFMSSSAVEEELSAGQAFALLRRSLDALTSARWWQSTAAQLGESIELLHTAESQVAAAQVAVLSEAASRGLPGEAGAKNPAAWLRALVPVTPAYAAARARLAEALPAAELSPTREAFAAGQISPSHAGVLVRTMAAIDALPVPVDDATTAEAQGLLLDAAARLDPAQLGKAGLAVRYRLDPDAADRLAHDEDAQHEAREAYVVRERSGMVLLRAVLPAVEGTQLMAALDPLTAPRPAAEDGTRDLRTARQRTADAVIQLARLALTAKPGQPGSLPTQGGSPTRMTATGDLATFMADLTTRDGCNGIPPGILHSSADGDKAGWAISPLALQTLACDAEVVPVLLDDQGNPLDVGLSIYPFPPKIRRAIEVRDKGCTWPTCTAPPGWCDAHHLIPHSQRGPTAERNGALLCPRHHRHVHAHGLTGRIIDGQVTWPTTNTATATPEGAAGSEAGQTHEVEAGHHNAHYQHFEHQLRQLAHRWLTRTRTPSPTARPPDPAPP
jgi:Domain of unknown function (DUF222)